MSPLTKFNTIAPNPEINETRLHFSSLRNVLSDMSFHISLPLNINACPSQVIVDHVVFIIDTPQCIYLQTPLMNP